MISEGSCDTGVMSAVSFTITGINNILEPMKVEIILIIFHNITSFTVFSIK